MKTKAWAFYATVYGPLTEKPFRISYSKDTERWWSGDGNTDVLEMGYVDYENYITFASQDKKEVQKFIDGFMAARSLMAVFTSGKFE